MAVESGENRKIESEERERRGKEKRYMVTLANKYILNSNRSIFDIMSYNTSVKKKESATPFFVFFLC